MPSFQWSGLLSLVIVLTGLIGPVPGAWAEDRSTDPEGTHPREQRPISLLTEFAHDLNKIAIPVDALNEPWRPVAAPKDSRQLLAAPWNKAATQAGGELDAFTPPLTARMRWVGLNEPSAVLLACVATALLGVGFWWRRRNVRVRVSGH